MNVLTIFFFVYAMSKLVSYVSFNSQGYTVTGPQNCHLWECNPRTGDCQRLSANLLTTRPFVYAINIMYVVFHVSTPYLQCFTSYRDPDETLRQ